LLRQYGKPLSLSGTGQPRVKTHEWERIWIVVCGDECGRKLQTIGRAKRMYSKQALCGAA
jgi:hypothetical protein